MSKIKQAINKIRFGHRATSEEFVKYLRGKGMTIGEDVYFYAPLKTFVDVQYPWQITIGNHVKITQGVIILTHDYSWSVLKLASEGAILGASGNVNIGNNVFIGMNAIILRGVNIGNDVIIGAGSVVANDCESGWVYAGNPAKKIISIKDYIIKRQDAQVEEAKELWRSYKDRFGVKPTRDVFHEYFMLFEDGTNLTINELNKSRLCGNYQDTIKYMEAHKPKFEGFDEFSEFCENYDLDRSAQ